MPIDNRYFGVWRVLNFTDVDGIFHNWLVEDFEESVEQEASPQYFVQGAPRSNILNIKGAMANIKLTAPLLISDQPRDSNRMSNNEIYDGLAIWYNFVNPTTIWSVTYADPGQLLKSASFNTNAAGEAKYTIETMADANFLASEMSAVPSNQDNYFLDWGSSTVHPEGIVAGVPYRVASFYDIEAEINVYNNGLSAPIVGLLEDFTINVAVKSGDFNYIGQNTQRKMFGITGVEVTYSGTLVSDYRSPRGYDFPWQAMSPAGNNTYGGTAKAAVAGIGVWLRDGNGGRGTTVIPNLNLYGENVVGTASSMKVNADRIRTTFSGRSWMTKAEPFLWGS